jgi:hypothetical protein
MKDHGPANLEATLRTLKHVHGLARSSDAGELLEQRGDIDADTLCAVAAVSGGSLAELGEMLAAGRLERWYYVSEQATYYASERTLGRLVAVGDSVKNPETASKTLHACK